MIGQVDFDDVDEKIIAILQGDGRISNRAVGREVGLSESAIRKRLKRLTSLGALSYGLVVDVDATGVTVSGWLSVTVRPARVRNIANFISAMEHCVVCCITTGSAMIRAYVYLDTLEDLQKLTRSISTKDGVLDLEFRTVVGHTQHRYGMILLADPHHPHKRIFQGEL
ncbi:MAG TPA: AsnC family transcriptional regulator [Vicinamibacterales bacterium]|nr:AsnC family transcriptional regulator [Vicinamibacterales bacterium]